MNLQICSDVSIFLAQAPGPGGPPGQPPGGSSMFWVMMLMMVGMYFLMIAPQRKKQKEHEKMIDELKTGDQIVTTGGIYGSIANIKADRFVVKVAEGTKMEFSKNAIQTKLEKSSGKGSKQ